MPAGSIRGMGQGFGHRNEQGDVQPGAPLPPAVGTGDSSQDLAQIARDIHALVEQFALPALLDPHIINLASGGTLRLDSLTRKVGSIIVSITTGKLDVWWSDMTGVAAGTIAHLEFTATGAPIQVVLPPAPRIFTLLANGAATQGCFTLSSL